MRTTAVDTLTGKLRPLFCAISVCLVAAACGSEPVPSEGTSDTLAADIQADQDASPTDVTGAGDAADTGGADALSCAGDPVCWLDQRDRKGDIIARCQGVRACVGGVELCVPSGEKPVCIDVRCATKKDGDDCDDDSTCTINDACNAGACTGKNICECATTADCAAKEDGSACTGTLYCNTVASPTECQVNPATVVLCPSALDTACATNGCDDTTGKCALKPKKDATACDDGSPCTAKDVCKNGVCAGEQVCACDPFTKPCQDDADKCNGVPFCDTSAIPWTCKAVAASVIACDQTKDTACLANTCKPVSGACAVTAVNAAGACDDGEQCTTGDTCAGGVCSPGTNTCACTTNADCADKDDGDKCNGTSFCNQATKACEPNPASVVSCKTVDNTACLSVSCLPKEGKCVAVPAADNEPCDDGNPCTQSDGCKGGKCGGGANTCPCTEDADCAGKDDGDKCNGTLFCDKVPGPQGGLVSQCVLNPTTRVHCQTVDDTVCIANACNKKSGVCALTPRNELSACDDGNPCTAGDACLQGACAAGANKCTCTQDADCSAKEDGDVCNGTLFCDRSSPNQLKWDCKVNVATIKTCSAAGDTACNKAQCDPKTGKCALADAADNTDCGEPGGCRPKAFCSDGKCEGPNVCLGCKSIADCKSQEDGNACNGTLICNTSVTPAACQVDPKTIVTCQAADGSGCSQWVCLYQDGSCVQTPVAAKKGEPCDDGNACTSDAHCQDLSCVGKPLKCDDGDPCTADSCDAGKCVHTSVTGKSCDDNNACTKDTCAGKECKNDPINGPCDDGDGCTGPDACDTGKCTGIPKGCDDTNPCTVDSCSKGACVHQPSTSASCDDGDACTTQDACENGVCKGKTTTQCDDKNPCTVDTCTATGCAHDQRPEIACDDGNDCTMDTCSTVSTCVHQAQQRACAGNSGKDCKIWACDSGVCKASNNDLLFDTTLNALVQGATLRTMFNHLVVVGTCGKSTDINGTQACGYARPLDSTTGQVFAAGGKGDDGALGATERNAGGLLMVGYRAKDDKSATEPWVNGVSADGKIDVSQAIDVGTEGSAWAIERAGQGYVAVGELDADGSGKATGRLWLLDGDGKTTAKTIVAPPNSSASSLRAVDSVAAGYVAAGLADFGGLARSVVVLAKSDGKLQDTMLFGLVDQATAAWAVAVTAASRIIIAETVVAAGARSAQVRAVDAKGGPLWVTKVWDKAVDVRLGLAQENSLVGVVGAIDAQPGAASHAQLALLDTSGNLVQKLTLTDGAPNQLAGIELLSDGTMALAGTRTGGNGTAAWLLRTSPFGVASCAALGSCLAGGSCDDNKPCTTDACTAAAGCTHKPLTAGALCDDDKACTGKDACDEKGTCAGAPMGDGAACEDGDACTVGDVCNGGACNSGQAVVCADGNSCTKQTCNKDFGCVIDGGGDPNQSCDAGNCQVGKCSGQGACVVSGAAVFSATGGLSGDDELRDAMPTAAGWMAVGAYGAQGANPAKSVVLTSPDNVQVLTESYLPAGMLGSEANALCPTGGGDAWVLGSAANATAGTWRLTLERYSSTSGKRSAADTVSWSQPGVTTGAAVDVRLLAGKQVAMLAAVEVKGDRQAWYSRYEPSNSKVLTTKLFPHPYPESPRALLESGQSLLIVGDTKGTGSLSHPFVRWLDPVSGNVGMDIEYHGDTSVTVGGAVTFKDGLFIVGQTINAQGNKRGWLAQIGQDGMQRFTREYASTNVQGFNAIAQTSYGAIVAGGQIVGKAASAVLIAVDHGGAPIADYSTRVASAAALNAAYADTTGIFMAGTLNDAAQGGQLWWAHTDAFAHATCAEAGVCVGKSLDQCADGELCTLDDCDGAKGCVHSNATGPCSPGGCSVGGQCKVGKCESDGDRMFVKSAGGSGQDSLHGVATHGFDFVAAGTTRSLGGKGDRGWLTAYAANGGHKWQAAFGDSDQDHLFDVARLNGGDWISVGKGHDGTAVRGMAVRATDAGHPVWTKPRFFAAVEPAGFSAVSAGFDGKALAVGTGPKAGTKGVGTAVLIAKDGTAAATFATGWALGDKLHDVANTPGGYVAVGERTTKDASTQALVIWLKPNDAALARQRTYGGAKNEAAVAVASQQGGAVFVLSTTDSSGAGGVDVLLSSLEPSGVTVWQRTFGSGGDDLPLALTYARNNIVLLQRVGGQRQLLALDDFGTQLWLRSLADVDGDMTALAAFDTGELLLAGESLDGADGRVQRVDAWGYTTCAATKDCANQVSVDQCPGDACHAGTCDGQQAGGCKKLERTGPCLQDGKPCRAIGACNGGTCASKGDKLADAPPTAGASGLGAEAFDIALMPLGAYYVVGRAEKGGFIGKLRPDGGAEWANPIIVGSAANDEVRAVVLTVDGGGLAVGKFNKTGSDIVASIVFDGVGKLGATTEHTAIGGYLHDLLHGADDRFYAVGAQDNGSKRTPWLVVTDEAGSLINKTAFAAPMDSVMATQIIDGEAAGTFAVAAWSVNSNVAQAWLHVIDGAGKQVWSVSTPASSGAAAFTVVLDGGNYVLGGTAIAGGTPSPAMYLVDHNSNKLIDSVTLGSEVGELRALARTDDGWLLAVGAQGKAPATKGVFVRMRASSELGWKKSVGSAGSALNAVLVHVDNTVVATGTDGKASMTVRADAFGNLSCADSGTCVQRSANDCATSDPCQAAACDAGKGCFTTPMPDGVPCDSGKTCKSGVCS